MYTTSHCPHCYQPVSSLAHRCAACGSSLTPGSTPMSGTQVVRQVPAGGRSWGRIAFLASMGGLVLAAITVGVAKSGDEPAAAASASAGDAEPTATAAKHSEPDAKADADADARRVRPRGIERAPDFTYQVTNAVCHRMSYCGERDEAARSICQIADSFLRARTTNRYDSYGYDSYDRSRRDPCDYAFAPTTACLGAIDALSCDGAPADLPSWLHAATALPECESAYRCTN